MNQRFAKLILGLALLAGFLATNRASAQVIPTNLWSPSYASSTITPRPSSLQIPCANIVGGCAGGGVSTSTSNTFTVPQNFTGISNTGTVTSTAFTATSSTSSYITNLNGNVALPTQAFLNAYGCPGYPSDATIDTCANDWYGFYNGVVSSTNFTVPVNPGSYTWSDTHGFLFTNPGETATLNCVAGRGTNFKSTAATGTMAQLSWGTGANPNAGIQNCSFIGTVTNQTSSISGGLTGILFGSSTLANGLTGAVIHGVLLSGFSAAENFANNAYNITTEDSWIQNSGYNVYDPSQPNGGESNRWTNDFVVSSANSTTTDCIHVAATSAEFDNVSHDACQLDVVGGHTVVKGGHAETTQTGTYGAYIPTRVQSGAVLDEFGMTYVQDGTGSNLGAAFVQNDAGSTLHEYGAFLSAGASTTPAFYTGGGTEIISGTTNNGGVTAGAPLDTIATTLASTYLPPWTSGATNASDTLTSAQTGNFLIPSIKFNYQQPSKALQSLANLVGWDWFIDPNKDLHFFLGDVDDGAGGGAVGAGGNAPISVDATSGQIEWNSLDVDLQITNMQNSVYVIGGLYIKTFTTSTTPDVFPTDGTRQFFTCSYSYFNSTTTNPYEAPIQVTLDGVPQTVGTANTTNPATVQVLYNDQQKWVQFTGGAPASGHIVKVFGGAKVPIVAHAEDSASVSTYGERQGVVSDSKIYSVPEAHARALAQVLQFGHPVYDVKFNTLVPGCAVGQAILVNLPSFGINKYLIIKRVEAVGFAPGDDSLNINGKLEYQIECIGSDNVTFTDLMTTILQEEASQTTVDDSTVTQNLVSVAETITIADAVTATAGTKPYKYGPTTPQARYDFATYS